MVSQKITQRINAGLRAALALAGLGSLFAGPAEAKLSQEPPRGVGAASRQITIRLDNENVSLSQAGRDLGSFELSDSAASQRLRSLLQQRDRGGAVEERRTISPFEVADGGAGFAWPRRVNGSVENGHAGIAGPILTERHDAAAASEKHPVDRTSGSRVVKE